MDTLVAVFPSGLVEIKIIDLARYGLRGFKRNGERPTVLGIPKKYKDNVKILENLKNVIHPRGVGVVFLENGMSLGKKMRMEVVEPVVEATEELAVLVDEALGDVDLPDVSSITGLGGGSEFVTILNEAAEVEVK